MKIRNILIVILIILFFVAVFYVDSKFEEPTNNYYYSNQTFNDSEFKNQISQLENKINDLELKINILNYSIQNFNSTTIIKEKTIERIIERTIEEKPIIEEDESIPNEYILPTK